MKGKKKNAFDHFVSKNGPEKKQLLFSLFYYFRLFKFLIGHPVVPEQIIDACFDLVSNIKKCLDSITNIQSIQSLSKYENKFFVNLLKTKSPHCGIFPLKLNQFLFRFTYCIMP